ncbi:molybdopterin-binding protein, partial [Chloroflexota bacterium]
FEKSELFIENIHLNHVNLDDVAKATAIVLGLSPHDVAVIDVRPGEIAIDILRRIVTLEQILGKRQALLLALCSIAGITITEETAVHSEGILGLVNLNEDHFSKLKTGVTQINQQISNTVRFRALVFPTGEEIIKGNIEDTNSPFLVTLLSDMGYKATKGKALEDTFSCIIGALRNAADMGYGLVITTGGVGAEDKDHLVEAIITLDPEAAAPYVVYYTPGHGRHKKDGVRIAVGSVDWTTFIALPGPHDEVQLVAPVLVQGLSEQWDKYSFAERLALPLRAKLVH